MIIIADESVDYAIIQALREIDFKVYSISEQSPGIDDDKVLDIADKHKGILLTEDKDFGKLAHKYGKHHHGIVLIRISGIPRIERVNIVMDHISENADRFLHKITVIHEKGIRFKGKTK